MKTLIVIFFILCSMFAKAQTTITAVFDAAPFRAIASKVLMDSGATIINTGQGAKLITSNADGSLIRVKSLVADNGIRIVPMDSVLVIQRRERLVLYSGSFTLQPQDDLILYSGGSGVCTLPSASLFPERSFTIVNKSSTTTSLNVGGFLLLGKRSGKWVSYNGQWVLVLQHSISTNY